MPRTTDTPSSTSQMLVGRTSRHLRLWLCACVAAMALALGTLLPFGPPALAAPSAPAHALPVRSQPAADAVLAAPPSSVKIWYSEALNPLTSHMVVVDTTNKEVDNHDSHVDSGDPTELEVSLPLLPAGTYVVAWRTQSAVDGHVVGGSYIFRIKRPDGTVPAVPPVLPTGHVPGGGGVGTSSGGLDGPSILQTISTWIALLMLTFWAGGMIWETWITPPDPTVGAGQRAARAAAARRFRELSPWALGVLLVADVGMVLALSAELAGDWSGLFSLPLLRAVLIGSKFGTFWWMRQVVAGLALALAVAQNRAPARWSGWREPAPADIAAPVSKEPSTFREWCAWGAQQARAFFPALARGWRNRTFWGRAQLVLVLALLIAFALSGHAAAVPTPELPYALCVDLLHLLGNAAWVGGLFYIGLVLVPALSSLPDRQRAQALAHGLPQFSALALVTVVVLAATGTLNTTIHLTSPLQFFTTAYGVTLAVKIEIFLIMAGVSYYHAFRLRPALSAALAEEQSSGAATATRGALVLDAPARPTAMGASDVVLTSAHSVGDVGIPHARGGRHVDASSGLANEMSSEHAQEGLSQTAVRLTGALEAWLQREAALGAIVLLCVALLAAFAGTLAPTISSPSGSSTGSAPSGPYISTPIVKNGVSVALKVDPNRFGSNTFTVTVKDANGNPVSGAGVIIATTMLDMDMGTQTSQLQATSTPGVYAGQSDLTMAGNWQVAVKVLLPNSKTLNLFTFKLDAGY
jgi:copper transport protein